MTRTPLRQTFLEQGYLFPFDALSQEETAAALAGYRAYEAVVDRIGGWLAPFRHFPKVHLVSRWADTLVHHERILDVVEQVLGPDLLAWSTSIFVRPAGSGATLAWHQDALHYGLEGYAGQSLRVWVALTPTSRANGTMRYAPRSHRSGLVAHEWRGERSGGSGDLEVAVDVDEASAVDVELRAGQFTMHDLALAHSSGQNVTGADRVNLAIDYVTPVVRPQRDQDSAVPVRGSCGSSRFLTESRPAADFDDAAVRSFHKATMLRAQRLSGVMMDSSGG